MNKYIKHFLTICKHKFYVAEILMEQGLLWQAITHDLSKFSPVEFFVSAKYFSGVGSPGSKEKLEKGYSRAWLNHKGRNKHHWQYWVDWNKNGTLILCRIPTEYIMEMAADIIGASKAYLGGKYNKKEPMEFFEANRSNWLMQEGDKRILKYFIEKFS